MNNLLKQQNTNTQKQTHLTYHKYEYCHQF